MIKLSAIGKVYARRLHDGAITVYEIPTRRLEETKEAWSELYPKEPFPEE